MAKLTVRKNARRTLSGKAKENHRLSPAQVATNRPRPKPRPTRKREKVAQDSPVLTNTFNTDQEAQGAAEALVSLHTHVVLCRPGLKAVSRPERAAGSRAVSKPQLWLDQA